MVTRLRRAFSPLGCAVVSAVLLASCQKVPLLAPSGSTISLLAGTAILPLNGSTELTAQVIEPSGTPPQSGTLVTFTTTLGTIQPPEASTDLSGRARVRFVAGGASGTAVITAISGGVSSGDKGSIKIAIGAAAVGGVTLVASPSTVPSGGGSATLTAKVLDTGGNPLAAVPVTFATDAGSLSASVVNTDATGSASTTLFTSKTAKVTATAGLPGTTTGTGGSTTTTPASSASMTVTVNSTGTITAGTVTPATPGVGQTVSVPLTYPAVGTTGASPITSVTVEWGDGRVDQHSGQPGVITHAYTRSGSFVVLITGFDSFGDRSTTSVSVTVINAEPSVGVTADNDNPKIDTVVTFTVTATIPGSPSGVAIQNIRIDFGDGKSQDLGATSPATAKHTYTSSDTLPGSKTVVATASATNGQSGRGTTIVTVKP